MNIELEESDRQVIILALAKLSLTRPGWHPACIGPLVDRLGGRHNYEQYRLHGPDQQPKGQKFLFRWHADGEDHEYRIYAADFARACLQMGRIHAAKFMARGGVPADFRMDIEALEPQL